MILGDQGEEHLERAATVSTLGDEAERAIVELIHALCLFESAADLIGRYDLAKIEKGSRNGRNSDAIDLGDLVGVEAANAMELDPLLPTATAPRDGYVNTRPLAIAKIQKRRALAMAEYRLVPARKDRGEPTATRDESAMADGIHAAMQADEPTRPNHSGNRRR